MAYDKDNGLHTIDVNHNKTNHPVTRNVARRDYEEEPEEMPKKTPDRLPKKPNKKKKSPALVAALVICGLLLLGLIVVIVFYCFVKNKYNLTNYESTATVADGEIMTHELHTIDENRETVAIEERESSTINEEDNIDEAMAELVASDAKTFYNTGEPAEANYVTNILLIGVDNRGNESQDVWYGNSDSMIMVSINSKTKQITLTSFMRDMYVYIPELDLCDKLNRAHAYGSSDFLCEVISNMFKVKVDKYLRVDFYSLIDIIDAAGGIDMYVSDDEKEVMNMYIYYMCKEAVPEITNPEAYYLTESGNVHLTGMQAVGYARIRYVGNADYERTERQRKVITAIEDNLKGMSLLEINNFADTVLPLISHNISEEEFWSYVNNALTYFDYEVVSQRVPFDDTSKSTIINGLDYLVPDYKTNAEMLIESIYGE